MRETSPTRDNPKKPRQQCDSGGGHATLNAGAPSPPRDKPVDKHWRDFQWGLDVVVAPGFFAWGATERRRQRFTASPRCRHIPDRDHGSGESVMEGEVRAPETDVPGVVWFNTPAPLSLGELRGRLVILDFWTFGCINCMHILPTLRRVEEAFPEEVVVIGVHSPKFAAERDPAQVAAPIRRQRLIHPVAHDPAL